MTNKILQENLNVVNDAYSAPKVKNSVFATLLELADQFQVKNKGRKSIKVKTSIDNFTINSMEAFIFIVNME